MQIAMIEGSTRVLGREQGYRPLPIKDERFEVNTENGPAFVHCMTSAWTPTPQELELLKMGASIHVSLMGTDMHPPILVTVGTPPEAT